jgi:hypothetical protein
VREEGEPQLHGGAVFGIGRGGNHLLA